MVCSSLLIASALLWLRRWNTLIFKLLAFSGIVVILTPPF